jgi:uncharacterized protein YjbJ (UPF0337 family)
VGELIDKAKGKVKQGVGKIIGDRELEVEGELDEAKGKIKGGFEDLKRDIKDTVDPNRQPPPRRP